MDGMTISDYVAVEEVKNHHRDGWGSTTALWVLVGAIIIVAIVYNWTKNCNEKVAFATGLSTLNGKIECIAPQVATLNQQMYGAAQAFAGLTVGVNDIKQVYGEQIGQLNNTVFYNPANEGWFGNCGRSRGCGCGTPSRIFAQTQTYSPKDQQVTVTETCGNDRC